jgi:hypothetical protein
MKNNYRGWKLSFGPGCYDARKYNDTLIAPNRAEIERKIDSYERVRESLKQEYLVEQGKIEFNG